MLLGGQLVASSGCSDAAREKKAPFSPPAPAASLMILPQVHLRKPCYDFYFL